MTLVSDGQLTMWEQLLNITPRQPAIVHRNVNPIIHNQRRKLHSTILYPVRYLMVSTAVIIFSLRKYFGIKLEINFPTETSKVSGNISLDEPLGNLVIATNCYGGGVEGFVLM